MEAVLEPVFVIARSDRLLLQKLPVLAAQGDEPVVKDRVVVVEKPVPVLQKMYAPLTPLEPEFTTARSARLLPQ